MELENKLSEQEADDFLRLRGQVLASFHAMMAALYEIHSRRLYRENFKSFEDFCQIEYNWDKRYAFYNAKAAAALAEISEELKPKVSNIRQATALSEVPEDKREKVLQAIPADKVTAKSIKETAEIIVNQEPDEEVEEAVIIEEPKKRLDQIGYPIPDNIIPLWDNAETEGKRLQKIASELKGELEALFEKKERYLVALRNNLSHDVGQIRYAIGCMRPFVVCPYCDGQAIIRTMPCKACSGRGFLSKHEWNNTVPKDVKEARV